MRKPLNKKPSIYFGQPDAAVLDALSKAALLDLCVELIRDHYARETGRMRDTPCSAEEIAAIANDVLIYRGDKIIKGGAR
jgi:hypothetical protein